MLYTVVSYDARIVMDFVGVGQGILLCTVALLFLIAGLAKFLNNYDFRVTIMQVSGIPRLPSILLACTLSLIEIGIGAGLLANFVVAKVGALLLLVLFALLGIHIEQRKLVINCNCFGLADSEVLGVKTARRNTFLIALILFSWNLNEPYLTPETVVSATLWLLLALSFRQVARNRSAVSDLVQGRPSL